MVDQVGLKLNICDSMSLADLFNCAQEWQLIKLSIMTYENEKKKKKKPYYYVYTVDSNDVDGSPVFL